MSVMFQEEFLIIAKIARPRGKFTSSFLAVRFGPLYYRSLERDKILAFKFAKGNFDKKMKVLQVGVQFLIKKPLVDTLHINVLN